MRIRSKAAAGGEQHYQKRAYKVAVGDLTRTVDLAPRSALPYIFRGMVYKFGAERQKTTPVR